MGVPISATAARYAQKAEQILRLELLFQPFCLIAEKLFPDALALGNLRQINFRRLPAMMRAGRTSRPPKASAIGCEACQPSEDQDGAWRAANHDRWEQFEKRR